MGTFWGETEKREDTTDEQWKMMGGDGCGKAHPNIRQKVVELDPQVKAMEVVHVQLKREGREELANPEWTEENRRKSRTPSVMGACTTQGARRGR